MRNIFIFLVLLFHLASFASAQTSSEGQWSVNLSSATQIKILNFNAWTVELPIPRRIYEVSHDIDRRLALLPSKIQKIGADIVVFEELWKTKRKKQMVAALQKLGFNYALYKNPKSHIFRGKLGNGLLIVSRYPLDPQLQLMHFSKYTRTDEYFTYKGAIKTRVNLPHVGWVDLYASHLGAVTTKVVDEKPDHFDGKQLQKKFNQAEELAQFIAKTSSSPLVVLATDLNTHFFNYENGNYVFGSFTPEYSLLTCIGASAKMPCLGLWDSYRLFHGFNEPAWTYDTIGNDYARGGVFAKEPPGAIDYIFVSQNTSFVPVKSEIVFTQKPLLSDHYGILTTFEVR